MNETKNNGEKSPPLARLPDTGRDVIRVQSYVDDWKASWELAQAIAQASLLPDHLMSFKGRPLEKDQIVGNLFLIVSQANRWRIDPIAAIGETYVVGGKLAYQGKLVAAVVNVSGKLSGSLKYSFIGAGDARTVTVTGQLVGEADVREISVSVGQAKTSNEMWRKNPDQKLVYTGAIMWARRHTPEIIQGVKTDDDLEQIEEAQAIIEKAAPWPPVANLADAAAIIRRGRKRAPEEAPAAQQALALDLPGADAPECQEPAEPEPNADDHEAAAGLVVDECRDSLRTAKTMGDVHSIVAGFVERLRKVSTPRFASIYNRAYEDMAAAANDQGDVIRAGRVAPKKAATPPPIPPVENLDEIPF